ncbi:peptidyl-prolyl cis-trans isomerase CYP19-4 precursor, putative [Entamoeba invadens IP1]|uniref:Peptidyl-prolyl cis-trans isomerase n=1 Tax=Entamoeba invadens IP1 TaxID=370355 RepID=A0A0A1TUQ9_ENTIV|nr:peptidyl-prolyl cis-trans isomerase CYP19-4 precursor, putative [Entamoeba invadens IP1]ELP83840.1 peptidyl-prolyl cis-trans isomerase CYP19-4 precursor, putative [Entamoeba invadens IP1]|eukprot:XP_004183186.1 peptidyl-prolyl cis-trans isomerase CYP19-4 precursor, putative [Entamoeba invadens IP1]
MLLLLFFILCMSEDSPKPSEIQEETHPITTKVFFDIRMGNEKAGRIVIGLYSDVSPKAVENFRALCTGEKGLSSTGLPLHYKGCKFHRVIPNFILQSGDITQANGYGGESIYGLTFPDENLEVNHTKKGLVSMQNNGPDTNNSQFMISLIPTPWFSGRYIVVGEVIEGYDLCQKIGNSGNRSGETTRPVIIENSGVLI